MLFVKDTKIKLNGKTRRLHANFKCEKCKRIVERAKGYGASQKTCGCSEDIESKIINRFLIIKDLGGSRKKVIARCPVCDYEKEYYFQSIKYDKIKSCGCNAIAVQIEKKTKHGFSGKRLYRIHTHIKQRCSNPNSSGYKYYGGRGITYCEEWKTFDNFKEWALKNGYEENLTIDRKDPNKDYSPDNCRWATYKEQAETKRLLSCNNTSGYRGVSYRKDTNKWSANITIDYKSFSIGCFNTSIEAAIAYDNYCQDNKIIRPLNESII